jgi:hypothetical protein
MGNVVAYNYMTGVQGGTWDVTFNHGPHNVMNLVEGNVFQNKYEDDGYFGSSSHNVLFRNVIPDQVLLKHFCNYYSVVGNVLGGTAPPDGYTRTYDAGEVNNYWSNHVFPIFELGFPNIGNSQFDGTFINVTTPPDYHLLPNTLPEVQQLDRDVRATILRHGNWSYADNAVIWDANIPDHNIPASLFYSSRPAWWDADLAWPPIGPDLTPMVGLIPAQKRFQGGPTPTPTGTPTPTATATATATPIQSPSPNAFASTDRHGDLRP